MHDYFHLLANSGGASAMEYVSILHIQKLCWVHLSDSTKYSFLGLLQFNLTYTYFYSR